MKEIRFKADPKTPYCLHDCTVNSMTLKEGNLKLEFEDGIMSLSCAEGSEVIGNLVAEDLDESCCKVILQGRGGTMGEFRGEKLTLSEFIEKHKDFGFEIIDEYYGWQRLQFAGWLWEKDNKPLDMTLSLGYFKGDLVYNVEKIN